MVKPQIIEERPLSLAELKETLQHTKEKEKDLNFRANKTEEYMQSIPILSIKDAKALMQKIVELNVSRLKQDVIVKLCDVLPKSPNDVKLILQNSGLTVTAENVKKIADIVNEYSPKQ